MNLPGPFYKHGLMKMQRLWSTINVYHTKATEHTNLNQSFPVGIAPISSVQYDPVAVTNTFPKKQIDHCRTGFCTLFELELENVYLTRYMNNVKLIQQQNVYADTRRLVLGRMRTPICPLERPLEL